MSSSSSPPRLRDDDRRVERANLWGESRGESSKAVEREGKEQEARRNRYEDWNEDDEERRRRRRQERERSRSRSRDRDRDKDRDRGKDRVPEKVRDEDRERRKEKKRRERERERDKGSRSASPSDRRKRKEAKSLAKNNARRVTELEQSRAVAELSMYTGADNPFHDANIGQQFVWNKKREKEKKAGLTAEQIARKDALRRLEAEEELAKLNKRRADREIDMQLRDEEEGKMRRLAEEATMKEWHAKEDDFQLEQSRRRAGIRLREQRGKAIDFLAINLRFADPGGMARHTAAIGSLANPRKSEVEREEEEEGWGWADAGFEFEIDEPWRIFDNLNLEDCEELEIDIKMYISLEKSPINIEFWEAMLQICEHHLDLLRDPDHAEGGRYYDREVDQSAGKIVSGLSLARLIELEGKTNAMLRSGQPVDGEFWDLVLKKIHVEKSVAKLNSIHEVVLKNRLEQFKKRQREEAAKQQQELGNKIIAEGEAATFGGDMHADGGDGEEYEDDADDEDDFIEDYSRSMSPGPVDLRTLAQEDRRIPVISEAEFKRAIFKSRRAVAESSFVPRHQADEDFSKIVTNQTVSRPSAADLEAEAIYRAEAEQEKKDLGADESEEEFGDLDEGLDLAPAASNYDWSDRYRPRKPRFFNRVQTGFEWNQYNQTHYDSENPPPKVVQGYKFNIFYPDLIDKSKAPIYRLERIPGDEDTQLIIFSAGPPYEDIAFRIVRHPWEYGHRRGFRSTFDRGVLQLYFNFGRAFYKK